MQRITLASAPLATLVLFLGLAGTADAQSPVFGPAIDIDQTKLLTGCPIATDPSCTYHLIDVLNSGGDFWTTPFLPYDPTTKTGDGYGEGDNGPRAAQRHAFNPQNPHYRFLRLNGLDSQSCFECHNSIGSETVDARGALIRKPSAVGGSAGSNSNAFINPLYPTRQTLFIRNPPAVFGSGYTQAVGDEMTLELLRERDLARAQAMQHPNTPVTQPLTAKGISFGSFVTTYKPGTKAMVTVNNDNTCPAGVKNPLSIGGKDGYADDVTKLDGVSCDLVIRPFQWKGVSSALRHFVRDALDFHFSMQAFEKVGFCDCDRDGKGSQETGTEVTLGQVSAMVAFVAMMRPPIQEPLTTPEQQRGEDIFLGKAAGSYQNMCANCHVGPRTLIVPNLYVEWPTSAQQGGTFAFVDPANPSSWPILSAQCPGGNPPPPPAMNYCPVESSYSVGAKVAAITPQNRGALVSPVASSQQLSIVRRYNLNAATLSKEPVLTATPGGGALPSPAVIKELRAPFKAAAPAGLTAPSGQGGAPAPASVVGQDYVIPLNPPDSDISPMQLKRLPVNANGTIDVPLFSDLKRHNMGTGLTDPPSEPGQGTDVADINTRPPEYLTRPLWGVADTGPWLHDGRALTLRDAILMHGDKSTGSDAGPVIDVFEHLSLDDQNAVVSFLETLRLPLPNDAPN